LVPGIFIFIYFSPSESTYPLHTGALTTPIGRVFFGLLPSLEKRPDTVGEPSSAENCAAYMPLLKGQEPGEANTAIAAVSRGNRFANSIRALTVRAGQKDDSDDARHERTLEAVA
jgi:hypothetical protein